VNKYYMLSNRRFIDTLVFLLQQGIDAQSIFLSRKPRARTSTTFLACYFRCKLSGPLDASCLLSFQVFESAIVRQVSGILRKFQGSVPENIYSLFDVGLDVLKMIGGL